MRGVIPDRLLPKNYVLVSQLPRNSIGKVDEQALANVPQKTYPNAIAFSDGGSLPLIADTPTTLIELLYSTQKTTGEIIYLEAGKEIVQAGRLVLPMP